MLWMNIGSTYSPLSHSFMCFGLLIIHQLFEDLVKYVNDSNLQNLSSKYAYDATSIIDYSKELL